MNMRAALGGVVLLGILGAGRLALDAVPGGDTLFLRLGDRLTRDRVHVPVRFPSDFAPAPGTVVYRVADEAFVFAGRVESVEGGTAHLSIDPSVARGLGPDCQVHALTPGRNLAWVLRTLAPPETRTELSEDLARLWTEQQAETLERMRPRLVALLSDLTKILADDFPGVLDRHRADLQRLVDVARTEIYGAQLRPVVESVLLPRLHEQLSSAAGGLAQEIAAKIDLGDIAGTIWTFTWSRYGLGESAELDARLRALFEKAALPVLRERTPALAREALDTAQRSLADPEVRQAIDHAVWDLLSHPVTHEVAGHFATTWVVNNQRLAERLRGALRDQEMRAPIDDLWRAAEPRLERHLQEILTRTDGQGMDHRLVRVLRRVVLSKDGSYLLLVPGTAPSGLVGGTPLEGRAEEDR